MARSTGSGKRTKPPGQLGSTGVSAAATLNICGLRRRRSRFTPRVTRFGFTGEATMVRYRKPVQLSDNIIDRRGASAAETAAAKAQALATQARWAAERAARQKTSSKAAKRQADELAEAISQAMKLQQRRPR